MESRVSGAVGWLLQACTKSGDGGIAAHYHVLRRRWAPSYPETTGYTVETLYACAEALNRPELRPVAEDLARYLLWVCTPYGGAPHWDKRNGGKSAPIVFDTGQVLFGWLAAYRETSKATYLEAGARAGDWLVAVQSPSGAWESYQYKGVVKAIDTRVAWALLELAEVTDSEGYCYAARRNLEWALTQQQANGWFAMAAFAPGQDPVTHTIAYVTEGLLESGLMLNELRYIEAAGKTAQALLKCQREDGALASTYDAKWRETSRSSCLTGNCQVALIWLRLYTLTRNAMYLDAARRAIGYVAAIQNLTTADLNIRGGIPGSYPIYGHYERFKYPNWAAKFFIDAVLALEAVEGTRAGGADL